ncbi:LOW QUALITY PROTEIN: hypothetical protein Dda_1485 [Drechslerella dactyloides]|uniref:Uncharacterized protein n=1 Tax=Drechslerella dactyloides TaxID=74499 RepID=A0AAD6NLV2_DREDA|nr:LOW QUALITY PROTEIN: hypothetical protein Dda_1485 [Drechslerella dactyloides]
MAFPHFQLRIPTFSSTNTTTHLPFCLHGIADMEDAVDLFDHLTIITESSLSFGIDDWSDSENGEPVADSPEPATGDPFDPRKPKPIELPPRQDADRFEAGGEHMASLPILKDSLKYYEKARRIYERNKEIITKLVAENQLKQQGHSREANENSFNMDQLFSEMSAMAEDSDDEDEESNTPEEQEDQFLDFVGQILKNINNLLNKDNYHYDSNWKSMVHELDIDEGFFFLNIHKIHEGGELYEFLMTVGRFLGEYRLHETYRLCTKAELARFREHHFGRFKEFSEKVIWSRLFSQICREKTQRDMNREEVYEFRELLLNLRSKPRSEDTERPIIPDKPYLPYIDDIIKATLDSDIQREFFIEEIAALAQNETYGGDMITHFLQNCNLDSLWYRISRDILSLPFIYQNRGNMDGFVRMRTILQRYRDLFFTEVTTKDGGVGYNIHEHAYANAVNLLETLLLEDEEEKLRGIAAILKFPVVNENGILRLDVTMTVDTEDDCRSDDGKNDKNVKKKADEQYEYESEDSDQVTVTPANLSGRRN